MAVSDEKLAEQAFVGSLAILAILVAAVGLIGVEQDKAAGIEYLAPYFEALHWFTAGISVVSGLLALLALERMRGAAVPIALIAWLCRVLIVGTVLGTVAFVWLT